jgi:anti-sigma B factor antagonist
MGVLAVPSHYPQARADVFRCTWTRSGDRSVVYVAGEVDLATAHLIVDHVAAALLDHSPWVVVDLRQVTFLDSAGVDALLAARDLAVAAGGALRIAGPGPLVLKVLRLTEVDLQFYPYRPIAEARTPTRR